ncbi:hypothetical protein CEP54_014828 [Fusarium duplospermum]|uniref:glucan endo-1,3-beta-D-glucosidase n=1 Tax=Fusarium duplospermum TaxID=1325734 RepID=A0A428NTJ0_9HYPO|nr:hypothetical protein CEP54_014828 [Fusarium duplospermum]
MKFITPATLAATGLVSALTQQCTGTALNEGGNWFCGAIKQILYEGFTGSGTYKAVSKMTSDGQCIQEDVPYSGPLAPLDEDLSVHVRGPFNLKEFAVYSLGSENKKRDNAPSPHAHARHHGHHHFHEQRKEEKRAEWVTATIGGKIVSWENSYSGDVPSTQAPTAPDPAAATEPVKQPPEPGTSKPRPDVNRKVNLPGETKTKPPAGGDWQRTAYYNAEQQVADNVVFLGNYGGDGSGIFDKRADTTWGNSLSYLNANGNGGSGSPKVLKDVYIPSNKEFAIFSADRCDESCGYSRIPEVAYKGFSGANKVFLFHFKMPLDGDRGEVDIYEVLASGDTKCKSTLHLEKGAGSSDYFVRPVDKFIKVATVFDGRTLSVAIKKLPDDFDLSSGLSDATVREWVESFALAEKGSSLYQLPA